MLWNFKVDRFAKTDFRLAMEEEFSLERRAKFRISEPFPTTLSGVDRSGEPFQVDCVLENMSSTGIYLKLPRQLAEGSEVEMVIKLSSALASGAGAAIIGVALRSDPQADESWGFSCSDQRMLIYLRVQRHTKTFVRNCE